MFEFNATSFNSSKRIFLFMLYFAWLQFGFASIMLRFLYIESRGLGASEIAQVAAIIALPWGSRFCLDLSAILVPDLLKHFSNCYCLPFCSALFSIIGTSCGTSNLLYFWLFCSNLLFALLMLFKTPSWSTN